MTEHVAFLMKDILLFAASFYLLKQDLARVVLAERIAEQAAKAEAVKVGYGAPSVSGGSQ